MDPTACPFVTPAPALTLHQAIVPAILAQALYLLYECPDERRYLDAADRYAVFSLAYPRDPVAPVEDRQRRLRLEQMLIAEPNTTPDPRLLNNVMSRSCMYGTALHPAYSGFRTHHPDDDAFDAAADAHFDWLQRHRTDRGHAYNVGYVPADISDPAVTDAAYTDDLRLAGAGLVGYYRLTGCQEALDSALHLADYYLRAHQTGKPDGAFVESLGTWCIGPWPYTLSCEHIPLVRMDQSGWGWTARGAVEFLTLLHGCLPANHPRAGLMRDRCIRSTKWQFSCQFPDGAIGMQTQDDKWLSMTAAALLAFADIKQQGWIKEAAADGLAPRVALARDWLLRSATEELIDAGGYIKVTGRTTPIPREGLAWGLAWTLQALLRLDETY